MSGRGAPAPVRGTRESLDAFWPGRATPTTDEYLSVCPEGTTAEALAGLLAPAALSAQIDTATVAGRVVDASGATVAATDVTVTNTETNFAYHAKRTPAAHGR